MDLLLQSLFIWGLMFVGRLGVMYLVQAHPADFGRTKRRVSNHMIHDPFSQRFILAPNSGPSLMRYRRLCLAKTDEWIVIRYRSPLFRVVDQRAYLALAPLDAKKWHII